MRKPDYWEPQEVQEQYAEFVKSHPVTVDRKDSRSDLARAVDKARGRIVSEQDMYDNIAFQNKVWAAINAGRETVS